MSQPIRTKQDEEQDAAVRRLSRRGFLGTLSGAAAVAGLGVTGVASLLPATEAEAELPPIGPQTPTDRATAAFAKRRNAARRQLARPQPTNEANDDETTYADYRGQFGKTLPHDALGDVDPEAYGMLVSALATGDTAALNAIPKGGAGKLANPQGAYVYDLVGGDSHKFSIPPAPPFGSAWEASEMAELYWQALTRDVRFDDFESDTIVAAAVADLNRFSDFRGPKEHGLVTPETLFRAGSAGDLHGPYISQFLYKPVPAGPFSLDQKVKTQVPADDYMTSYAAWLSVQRGTVSETQRTFDPQPRYIRCGRDLANWVHNDYSYQAFLHAGLILLSFGLNALASSNPYKTIGNQGGFCTLGGPDVLDLVARAANCALHAAWYQKWLVHRRLRPEAFAGRVHNTITGAKAYDIHPELIDSVAVAASFSAHGNYLLPMNYPEGAPAHPAYPAGHAAISGACITVLKAFFNPNFVIPGPVVPDAAGLVLVPYAGGALTVANELDKLASNIAIGRDTAGVHWRTDGIEGIRLGEQVGIWILRDLVNLYNEAGFHGFSVRKFDGSTEVILKG